jgi:hypothetical protein
MSPLEKCPLFWKSLVHKKGTLFKFLHFEIASLINIPGHCLTKCGTGVNVV